MLVTGHLGSVNVTTVTPSDQAGADSARRSATIPTQRSGRALRLLVLGTGPEAAAFKARAAETGAELAQRFSSRVTHVVVGDGIGEQDARVVRARAADIPVLGLAEGAELFDAATETQDAELDTTDTAAKERGGGQAEDLEQVEQAEQVEQTEDAEQVERVEIRPSDVFTGSALEAALLFPPLTVDEGQAAPASALMEVASAACGCVDDEKPAAGSEIDFEGEDSLEAMADGEGDAGGDGRGSLRGDEDGGEGEVSVVDAGPSGAPVAAASGVAGTFGAGVAGAASVPRRSGRSATSIAWALVPLLSLGLLTPVALGYAAHRLRSRTLAVATMLYSVAVVAAFTVSAAAPLRTGSHSAVGDLLTGCLTASWLGGTLHAFLIRRRVF